MFKFLIMTSLLLLGLSLLILSGGCTSPIITAIIIGLLIVFVTAVSE